MARAVTLVVMLGEMLHCLLLLEQLISWYQQ
jgi:hypothetical protein